jgi:glycerate 2-kinase
MSIINQQKIVSHGNSKGREIAIDIASHAIRSVSSYNALKKIINISSEELNVGKLRYELSDINNIHIFGAGKATMGQARALDELLGSRITKGIIIVKKGQRQPLINIEVVEGGHPIPDEGSYQGAKKILEAAKHVSEGDLIFLCDSGGSSALMSHPAEGSGIRFEDEKKVTQQLLMSGAPIYEVNAVRRHITAMKGGRLQKQLLTKGAEVINFWIPDAPRIRHHPDPWTPRQGGWEDQTTFKDAVNVLRRYNLWDETPDPIKRHLTQGLDGLIPETPKDYAGMKVHIFTLGSITAACEAAERRASELGLNSLLMTTVLEGESREAGIVLASIAKEVAGNQRPIKPPCALIFGGETTVTITGESGKGGPSQELALGFATKIDGNEKIILLALDTDGTDGMTEFAGGLVDGYTMERAGKAGFDVYKTLDIHNSSQLLEALDDVVYTGSTDTNVCDLNIVVITE